MPLSSEALLKVHAKYVAAIAGVTIGAAPVVLADSNNNASSHQSLIAVPSMSEDFVRAPDLNSRDLVQPRPGDFRYLKMNYGKTKGDPDVAKEDENPGNKPIPSKSAETTGGTPADKLPAGAAIGSRQDRLGQIDLKPLNLTPEQRQKIAEMRLATAKKIKEVHAALKAKKDELLNATFDPDISEAAIREKRLAVRALHEQQEDLMFEDLMGVRNLLTSEQKKHLAEIKPLVAPKIGPVVAGPYRMESARNDAIKSDAPGQPSIARSDLASKADSSKGLASKGDLSPKPDQNKPTVPKN
jgi:Spy/CpxP family protein refolding chaperone